MKINNYILQQTCYACPEQYDLFDENQNQVAYLRLRHGYFYCDSPDIGGKRVYETHTIGDGIFNDEERHIHIKNAIEAVHKFLGREGEFVYQTVI
jgi:hypothetical protein